MNAALESQKFNKRRGVSSNLFGISQDDHLTAGAWAACVL